MGHIHTTISTLKHRVKELESKEIGIICMLFLFSSHRGIYTF